MNYPLISEYIEAIKAAEDNFEQLKNLRPVLDENGEPMFSSGNFAVVFKMKDEKTGRHHAVKCFLREQDGRAEAYRQIAEELEYVSSTFLTPIKYLDKELFVDTSNSDESEFPVLLMDWVEGQTLDKYIRELIDDQYGLSLLAYQFSRLAMWLMPQTFAHGDLKPDNILVKEDGTLVLVDYDGMYVPAMKGQKARELGSPDFRHPSRTEDVFDEHIDDFSLASILLSLKAIALQPELLEQYGASDRLLFSANDYRNISQCSLLKELNSQIDSELRVLVGLFTIVLEKTNLIGISSRHFNLYRPKKVKSSNKIDDNGTILSEKFPKSWTLLDFARQFGPKMQVGNFVNKETGEEFKSCVFTKPNGTRTFVAFSTKMGELTPKEISAMQHELYVIQLESGKYSLCKESANKVDEHLRKEVSDAKLDEDMDQLETIENFVLPDGSIYNGEGKVQFGSLELCGQGEVVYKNGDKYTGSFKYGRPLGWGKYKFSNGHVHRGYFDTFPNGIGYLNENYGMTVGNYYNGKLHGWGIYYRHRIFKFGYWDNGKLVRDETNNTLWIRSEITKHRFEYQGNLIQIGKEHEFIRFGIPQKLLDTPSDGIAIDVIPKLPAWGFEFFKDGTAKVGIISNHTSGDYLLCKPNGTIDIGKWKDDKKTSDISSFNTPQIEGDYEVEGIDVYKIS